eukprot:jgi/Astpho2/8126/fgenesh1_pg.00120_%23_75_t
MQARQPHSDAIGPEIEAKRSRQAPPTHEVDLPLPLHTSHTGTQHAEGSLQTPRTAGSGSMQRLGTGSFRMTPAGAGVAAGLAAIPGVQAGSMQTSPPGSPRMAASPMLHAVCGRQAESRMVRSPTQRRPSAQLAGQHTFRPFKMLSSPSKRAGLQQLNAQVAQAAQADRLAERQRGLRHDLRTATQEAPAPGQGAGARRLGPGMSVVVGGRVSGQGCTRLVFGPAQPANPAAAGSSANTIERAGSPMDTQQ